MWLPAVKSVCALSLLAKNTPPPKHMCCSPSLSALSWGPQFPMHDDLHLITKGKTNSVYGAHA